MNDPLWYKDAIIYQTHVRAYCDSIGDGVGDFRGLTTKLDYLRDLGVTTIWLLPFYPSPLKDDGYDIADYTNVHPQYGTIESFKEFLDGAHERGLRVITELVINHTSDQHPWFQRARRAPKGSPERDFYVWSDKPDKYLDARIIFKDFEPSNWTYDNVADAYYWHRFYSHQPDLNFDNPEVGKAIFPQLDFWMEMGVDGMRLDAVPYLYEREGTNCENLPETHAFLKSLRAHMDAKYPGRMLLAEANQWPEDAVAYFGDGDECHMAFHFPVMPRLFMAIHREDRFPIIDIMDQTPEIPPNCQWAMFLRNHDELTLEMVTDEERDYMYRAYAHDRRARINLGIRRRLAPLLGNNRRKIELMNALLFSMPGTPVIYYGDEIGMGDNIYLGDRNGVRTPMQWSADRNAGFSRANPQKLYLPVVIDPEYHYETINVEAQQNNPNSLLWWTKRLIDLRKRYKAFGRGTLEFLHPDNRKVLAFVRSYKDENILVVVNLSRFVQYTKIDLSQYRGAVPIELFGSTPFPRIGRHPYMLTLGPHSFFWFSLSTRTAPHHAELAPTDRAWAHLQVQGPWENVLTQRVRQLEALLPRYIEKCRWYDEWPRTIRAARLHEHFQLPYEGGQAILLVIDVDYNTGDTGTYVLPLAFTSGQAAADLLEVAPDQVLCKVEADTDGILYDALRDVAVRDALVELTANGVRLRGSAGNYFTTLRTAELDELRQREGDASLTSGDVALQTNGVICDNGRLVLKFMHRLEEGVHPSWEVGKFLSEKKEDLPVAPVAGALEFRTRSGDTATVGVLHGYVRNEGNAWQVTLDALSDYSERVLALESGQGVLTPDLWPTETSLEPPELVDDLLGNHLDEIELAGQRIAQVHRALASDNRPEFAPEKFSTLQHRSDYQTMRTLKMEVFDELRRRLPKLPSRVQRLGREVLRNDAEIMARFRKFAELRLQSLNIRCHGDLHLGNILATGRNFVLVNFIGGPLGITLSERKLKRSPLRDVATLLRSFHYAAQFVLFGHGRDMPSSQALVRREDLQRLRPWIHLWYRWVSHHFLFSYCQEARGASFLSDSKETTEVLLKAYMLERALRELKHELRLRTNRVSVPLAGILDALGLEDANSAAPPAQLPAPPAQASQPASPSS